MTFANVLVNSLPTSSFTSYMVPKISLSRHSVVAAIAEQVSCELDGETIVLAIDSGKYYSLNNVGARIWGLIQIPISVADLSHTLMHEYEVDAETCMREVLALLHRLAENRLIAIQDSSSNEAH